MNFLLLRYLILFVEDKWKISGHIVTEMKVKRLSSLFGFQEVCVYMHVCMGQYISSCQQPTQCMDPFRTVVLKLDMLQNHLESLLRHRPVGSRVSFHQVWRSTCAFAFLTSFQELLLVLVEGPHLANHCSRGNGITEIYVGLCCTLMMAVPIQIIMVRVVRSMNKPY